MSNPLSSDAAKGFAVAGVTVLGLIGVNRLGKRLARSWRNMRSDEKPATEPVQK